jgi:hypothetical protein
VDDVDIVLSVLGSASTLYGFSIAYYAFARSLQDQERERQWRRLREDTSKVREVNGAVLEIEVRRAWLGRFLIGSSLVFGLLLVVDALSLWGKVPSGVAVFFALGFGVIGWFLFVGRTNLNEALCEIKLRRKDLYQLTPGEN